MQKPFLSVLPKKRLSDFLRMQNESAQRKLAKYKKISRDKIWKQSLSFVSKMSNLEAKKRHSGVR